MIVRWQFDEEFNAVASDQRLPVITAEILRAHRQGNHLVVMDRKVAAELSKLGLSSADQALLGRLSSEFTQTGGLHRRSDAYLAVKNSLKEGFNKVGSALEVSLGTISASRLLDPSVLLVENLSTDGWFLSHIFSVVASKNKLGSVNFDSMHGGGDDIANVLEAIVPSKRIAVAVVDSDKNAPMSPQSPKITRLEKIFAKHGWPFGKVSSPPCRELENLVPLDVLMQIPSGVGSPTNNVLLNIADAEDRMATQPSDRFQSYTDIKLGFSSTNAHKIAAEELDWLKAKLESITIDVTNCVIQGYGEKVVNQIMVDGRHISALRAGLNSRAWSEKFLSFFTELLWYFLCGRRLIT